MLGVEVVLTGSKQQSPPSNSQSALLLMSSQYPSPLYVHLLDIVVVGVVKLVVVVDIVHDPSICSFSIPQYLATQL